MWAPAFISLFLCLKVLEGAESEVVGEAVTQASV